MSVAVIHALFWSLLPTASSPFGLPVKEIPLFRAEHRFHRILDPLPSLIERKFTGIVLSHDVDTSQEEIRAVAGTGILRGCPQFFALF